MKTLKGLELHVTQKDHWSVISRVLSVDSCLNSVTLKQVGLDLENFYNLVETLALFMLIELAFIIRHATYLTRIWGYTERDVFFLYTPAPWYHGL